MKTNRINQVKYLKTKKGLVTRIYSDQIKKSKQRNQNNPSYTKSEFKEWLLSQPNFDKLYNDWVESGYDKWFKPSVDRVNSLYGYSFDNIQLMTWRENNDKGIMERTNNAHYKRSRIILQFDLDGNFIKQYNSFSHAQKETGIWDKSIRLVCDGIYAQAKGFFWKYL